jgi:hypothetical protein
MLSVFLPSLSQRTASQHEMTFIGQTGTRGSFHQGENGKLCCYHNGYVHLLLDLAIAAAF